MRDIKKLVIHCSATQDSIDIGAREIRILHISDTKTEIDWYGYKTHGRGWSDIGYHYVIRRNGEVEVGRPESISGAHVAGHNSYTLGICVVGVKDYDDKQMKSLFALIKGLVFKYDLDITEDVVGHYEFEGVKKTCPNMDMVKLRAELVFK